MLKTTLLSGRMLAWGYFFLIASGDSHCECLASQNHAFSACSASAWLVQYSRNVFRAKTRINENSKFHYWEQVQKTASISISTNPRQLFSRKHAHHPLAADAAGGYHLSGMIVYHFANHCGVFSVFHALQFLQQFISNVGIHHA